jgi:hypothetical protein
LYFDGKLVDVLLSAFVAESFGVEETALLTASAIANGASSSEENVEILAVGDERISHYVSLFVKDDATSERYTCSFSMVPL